METLSPEHVAALAVTAAGVAAAVWIGRERPRWAGPAGRALAVVVLAAFAAEQLTYALRGTWSAKVNLPFQLSDGATFVAVAALLSGLPLLVELLYFWAFTASLQAVLTPDLRQSFPDVLYFTYFATHCGAILAATLLVIGCRRLPRPGAARRAYAITAGFAAIAATATIATGGNYMFLRRKPRGGSLLDLMGPWPLYIAAGGALGLALFLALEALARFRQTERA